MGDIQLPLRLSSAYLFDCPTSPFTPPAAAAAGEDEKASLLTPPSPLTPKAKLRLPKVFVLQCAKNKSRGSNRGSRGTGDPGKLRVRIKSGFLRFFHIKRSQSQRGGGLEEESDGRDGSSSSINNSNDVGKDGDAYDDECLKRSAMHEKVEMFSQIECDDAYSSGSSVKPDDDSTESLPVSTNPASVKFGDFLKIKDDDDGEEDSDTDESTPKPSKLLNLFINKTPPSLFSLFKNKDTTGSTSGGGGGGGVWRVPYGIPVIPPMNFKEKKIFSTLMMNLKSVMLDFMLNKAKQMTNKRLTVGGKVGEGLWEKRSTVGKSLCEKKILMGQRCRPLDLSNHNRAEKRTQLVESPFGAFANMHVPSSEEGEGEEEG